MYLNTKHEMFLIHLLEIHIALQQNTNNRIDLFIVKDLNRGSYRCIICNWDYFIENILETYRKTGQQSILLDMHQLFVSDTNKAIIGIDSALRNRHLSR